MTKLPLLAGGYKPTYLTVLMQLWMIKRRKVMLNCGCMLHIIVAIISTICFFSSFSVVQLFASS